LGPVKRYRAIQTPDVGGTPFGGVINPGGWRNIRAHRSTCASCGEIFTQGKGIGEKVMKTIYYRSPTGSRAEQADALAQEAAMGSLGKCGRRHPDGSTSRKPSGQSFEKKTCVAKAFLHSMRYALAALPRRDPQSKETSKGTWEAKEKSLIR